MAYEHFVCQYFSFLSLEYVCRFAFVVISVYCFLYIFLLEFTKSYSNASHPNMYLAYPSHPPVRSYGRSTS